jgi:hypothetical protein
MRSEMSGGRRHVYVGLASLLTGGGLLTVLVLNAGTERPVEARRVDHVPMSPRELTATYTTSVVAVDTGAPHTAVPPAEVPSPPRPAPQADPKPIEPPAAPLPAGRPTTARTPSFRWEISLLEGLDGCDNAYQTDGVCVPWRLPLNVPNACEWLRQVGVTDIQVHGSDRLRLDVNLDGIACGEGD